jgi:hypothetical protein
MQDTKRSVDALLPLVALLTKGSRDDSTTSHQPEIPVINAQSKESRIWENVRKNWTVPTMVAYLTKKGFEQYSSIFLEHEVDGSLFCCITSETLAEWGLSPTHVSKFVTNRDQWRIQGYLD